MALGYQFQPDEERRLRLNINQPAGQFSPGVSEAIRVLSLRLPNVLGGRPIAPDDLLRPGVGGAGVPAGLPPPAAPLPPSGPAAPPMPGAGPSGPNAPRIPNATNPTSYENPDPKTRIHYQPEPDFPGGTAGPPPSTSGPGSGGGGYGGGSGGNTGLNDVLEFLLNRRPDRGKV